MIPFALVPAPALALTDAAVALLFAGALRASLLLVAAAVACGLLRRRSAAVRHLVWVSALAASLAMPVLPAVLPEWPVLPMWSGHSNSLQLRADDDRKPRSEVGAVQPTIAAPTGGGMTVVERFPPEASQIGARQSRGTRPIAVLCLWSAGACILLTRLARNTCRVARLAGASPIITAGPLAEVTAMIAARLEIAAPTLHQGPAGAVPIVWGLRQRSLLLPAEAADWDGARLAAVITHELAHLRRRDICSLLAAHLACAIHWFNPLAWYAVRRVRIEQEQACDDYVLRHGTLASDYATHLIDVAARLTVPPAVVVAMIDSTRLEHRVCAILDAARNRSAMTRSVAALLFVATSGAAILISILRADASAEFQHPGSAHWFTRGSSAHVSHLAEQVQWILLHDGELHSSTDNTFNSKSRTWQEKGTLSIPREGSKFDFERDHTAPGQLTVSGKAYDLTRGRVFLLRTDGSVRQLNLKNSRLPVSHDDVAKIVAQAVAALPPDRQQAKSNEADREQKPRSLDIVIAEHVIMWDGEIVTWEQVVDELRARRNHEGRPIHPNFRFTHRALANGREKKYSAAAYEVYKELFEPAGMSIGSISPRAGERYDSIREPADLLPKPEQLRTGVVRSQSGQPAWRATVFLMPENAMMPVMLRPNVSLRDPIMLRDTLDEVWTITDREGKFRIAAPDTGHRLVVFAPQGFAVVPVPKSGEPVEITLSPRCEVEIASADKSKQKLAISVHLPELPNSSPGFAMFEVEISENTALIQLPPGRVAISRSFDVGEGVHVNLPAETFELKPGARKALSLSPPDPKSIPTHVPGTAIPPRTIDLQIGDAGQETSAGATPAADADRAGGQGLAEFKRLFALADGEVLKRIGPPFPECRMAYWQQTYPAMASEQPDFKATAQFIRFKDGDFNLWGGLLVGRQGGDFHSDLPTILNMTAGIPRYAIEGDSQLVATSISGDFVYRQDAKADELIPRLSAILRDELKLPIKLTLRDSIRRSFVASGEFHYAPLAKNARGRVIIGGRPSADDPLTTGGGGSGSLEELLKLLGDEIRFPILSEVVNPPERVGWFCYKPKVFPKTFDVEPTPEEAERQVKAALDIITEQTGLKFEGRFRKMQVVLVEAAEK